ncbi:hypothetical protein ABIA25_005072 [Sinorhizobium fredii]
MSEPDNDPCIAAEAVGKEYPASDMTVTRRSRTSIFCNVIRYILHMSEDYQQPCSCQLSARITRDSRSLCGSIAS